MMKKDYVVISNERTANDENAFIEQFWTERWEQAANLPKADSIRTREEYQAMRPFLEQLPQNSRILDGGCGLGEWTVFLTTQGFQVVGFDLSQKTIERLQAALPQYHFAHGDIRQTPFADAEFDAYFSWGTFEHFENGLSDCFQEAFRILKPGGWLFVSVPFYNLRHLWHDLRPLHVWDELFDREHGYVAPLRFYQWRLTKTELQREFERHGFHCESVLPIGKSEGVHRMLHHDYRLQRGSAWHRRIYRLIFPLIPQNYACHMILGMGYKRT